MKRIAPPNLLFRTWLSVFFLDFQHKFIISLKSVHIFQRINYFGQELFNPNICPIRYMKTDLNSKAQYKIFTLTSL